MIFNIQTEKLTSSDITVPLLRYARQNPILQQRLDLILADPIERGLCGLQVCEPIREGNLEQRVLSAIAYVDAGGKLDKDWARTLEQEACDDPKWWVPAVKLHGIANPQRELEARRKLSEQSIPFVFPGDLHALQVEIFAFGSKTLHVLHVDWLRKLAEFTCQALHIDCQALGFWFLPIIDILPEKIFVRQLKKTQRKSRFNIGSRGVLAVYYKKLILDPTSILQKGSRADLWIYHVAIQQGM